jgi:hypothetical protein
LPVPASKRVIASIIPDYLDPRLRGDDGWSFNGLFGFSP